MIEATCLDADNRPKEVEMSEWITKGMKYHITHVFFHPGQGIQGCSLREVRLTSKSHPYGAYALKRFGVTQEGMKALVEMMLACSELNEFDVYKAIEESELQTVEV